MRHINFYLVLIIVIVFLPFILFHKTTYLESDIEKWAVKKNYKVVETEMYMTIFGTPFNYVQKNCFIYEIKVINSKGEQETWWFRETPFGENDYLKE